MSITFTEDILRFTNAAESPHLVRTVNTLAEKAGLSPPKIAYFDLEKIRFHPMRDVYRSLIGMGHLPRLGDMLIIGDVGAYIGDFKTPSSTVSDELKAVFAHEFAHAKYGDARIGGLATIGRRFPTIGALSGLGSLLIYDYYHKHPGKKSELSDTFTPEAPHSSSASLPLMQATLELSRYAAAAAFGMAAGKAADIGTKWVMELRADKFAATLLNDGKPLANYLTKFNNANNKGMEIITQNMRDSGVTELDILKLKAQQFWLQTQLHPPAAWRIARLENMSFPAR